MIVAQPPGSYVPDENINTQHTVMAMPVVRNNTAAEESLPKYTPPMFSSPHDLEHFPIIFWGGLDDSRNGHENGQANGHAPDGSYEKGAPNFTINCGLCSKTIPQGVPIRSIPCSHVFHVSCLDYYLLNISANCPTCNLNLFECLNH
ncbi:E3 ubiquitin-protein ligase [Zancudomyces culisetae]|uniref:RING-type E3 ubiquitin transferase n=2 Tax=Zancudomyces culisetae TaxID=1213189 RepID=A0A1R1PF59_ZANCU|nr:E3 ubiquitin-protein ligase [Zancudomyces culisetae]|eukprot:OMH79502.1 E3 ubiquitin-protein ligase [Zancudomyces culisetae]